ncbi:C40 family peptidase [Paenibacillus sp. DMB20]|uniref:C40 family peptidase n=1 Tax=Paenibacillus sp. DMB20 TaxID=1642570 RepID=UPI000B199F55|nr:SH3 domain-containing C40 family peptidase [Paenibacillus sp. DMB20]
MHMNWKKIMAGALLSVTVMGSYVYGSAAYAAAASAPQSNLQQGQAKGNVYLRSAPTASGKIAGKIRKGEKVQIMDKSGSGWYAVKTSAGVKGYASSKYIAYKGSTGSSSSSLTASASVEKVIRAGMKYLGTPYEFSSDRSTTATFDCSDFIRQVFMEGAGIKLPGSSRTQGDWIREKGTDISRISDLKRGDLIFFMSYKGSSASNYAGLDKSKQRITHVAIYLGDNKLLHTYSQKSGGVLVGSFSDSWKNRFLFGGSVL